MAVADNVKILPVAKLCAGIPRQTIVRAFRMALSNWGLILSVLAICWFLFFFELRGEWQINPQYNYGYAVPLLSAMLFWRRWPGRPTATVPAKTWPALAIGVVLLFEFLPLRLILEANPEWRLLYWLNALQVLGLSGCLLFTLGGRQWVRYFAPPLLFALVAVPWPMGLETAVIQGLMRWVASLTVELTGWLGIPAVQQGNLIEVSNGIVGIDEACSGVRSLQSGLMLSLFLGEMHRFRILRRWWLVAASLVFVLLANLARTSFLVWAAASRGLAQMEAWHNSAGVMVMLVVLPGLLLLAHLMRPRTKPVVATSSSEPPVFPAVSRWVGVLAAVWLAFCGLAVEAWYRLHETKLVSTTHWGLAWPAQSPGFKRTLLPEQSLAILRCSNSQAGVWQDNDGNQWSAFLLRWAPGKNSAQLAKGHRPDICFPATGARLSEDFGTCAFSAGDLDIAFRHQGFESSGKVFHVFYCLWADRMSPAQKALREDGSQASRLEAVVAGQRNVGQQVLELVIIGPQSPEEAVQLMRINLPKLIRVEGKGSNAEATGMRKSQILLQTLRRAISYSPFSV